VKDEPSVGVVELLDGGSVSKVVERAVEKRRINDIFWRDVECFQLDDGERRTADARLATLPPFTDDSVLTITRRPPPAASIVSSPFVPSPRSRSLASPSARVLAIVGRLCTEPGVEKFSRSSVGSGVWYGKGGVVLTALHVLTEHPQPFYYYYHFDRDADEWVVRRMERSGSIAEWDIATLQQVGQAKQRHMRGPISAYEPEIVSFDYTQPGADVWHIGFPMVITQELATERDELEAALLSTSASQQSVSSSSSAFAPQTTSSSVPAQSSSASSSIPSINADESEAHSPAVTKGTVVKVGADHLRVIADYIGAPASSGGAVVARSESGRWVLIGIHTGVIHHDIDEAEKLYSSFPNVVPHLQHQTHKQATQAAGTCPFGDFITIMAIRDWTARYLPANVDVIRPSGGRQILGKRRTPHSAVSSGEAGELASGEGRGGGDAVSGEGDFCFYDRRVSPLPRPERPRAVSEPSPPLEPPATSGEQRGAKSL
jgi:hypothetical protein